ncbi:MAG TPA: hypothetical protein VJI96_03795 [Candidatus Andersenbacteria bacterium]|nr:hypothetical protein [Candidatus Andersenbacteria bacterium]
MKKIKLIESILAGAVQRTVTGWEAAAKLLLTAATMLEEPFSENAEVGRKFVSRVLELIEVQIRLQHSAEDLGINSSENSNWSDAEVRLIDLHTFATYTCECFGEVEFDKLLFRRLVDAELITPDQPLLRD